MVDLFGKRHSYKYRKWVTRHEEDGCGHSCVKSLVFSGDQNAKAGEDKILLVARRRGGTGMGPSALSYD